MNAKHRLKNLYEVQDKYRADAARVLIDMYNEGSGLMPDVEELVENMLRLEREIDDLAALALGEQHAKYRGEF